MPESFTDSPVSVAAEPVQPVPLNVVRSSRFRYYIHDGIESCRLELLGDLTAAELPELKGCWRTAKTTLGKRKLILDCKGLKIADEAGRDWVTSMEAEGALCLPQSFSKGAVSLTAAAAAPPPRRRRFGKLLAILRSLRPPFGPSSTQAQ